MTGKKFTLLELHVHDGVQLTIGETIGLGEEGNHDADGPAVESSHDHGDHGHSHAGRNAVFLVLGLLVGVTVAVTARRVLGSDLEAAEELDDVTD